MNPKTPFIGKGNWSTRHATPPPRRKASVEAKNAGVIAASGMSACLRFSQMNLTNPNTKPTKG